MATKIYAKKYTRDSNYSKIKPKPTTTCLHCKKMEYWKLKCLKIKSKAATNTIATSHTSRKKIVYRRQKNRRNSTFLL